MTRVVTVIAVAALDQHASAPVRRRAHGIPSGFESVVAAVVDQQAQALVVTNSLCEHLRHVPVVARQIEQYADTAGTGTTIRGIRAKAPPGSLSHRRIAVRQLW